MTVLRGPKRITFSRFPRQPIVAVNVDGQRIGTYEIVEAGFIPNGRKVPRKREIDARFLVILDEATRRINEAHRMIDSARVFFWAEEIEMDEEAVDGDGEYQSWR